MDVLDVTIMVEPNATVVRFSGSADVSNVAALDQKLMVLSAQRPKCVIFDLGGLRFISSICMGSFIRFNHGLTRVGGCVSLACAQPAVLEAMQRARFDKVFTFHETLEGARQVLAVAP
jgi:anti-anti-sigma factor